MVELSATLRRLVRADTNKVLAIEQQVHVSPWSLETFKACFDAGYDGWVFEAEGRVIGFILVSVRAGESHILNICVARQYQRKGWGRKLLEEALTHARRHGIAIAYLEVRRSNSGAIKMYQNMGFQLIGERKNYYPTVSGQEDALVFAKDLSKSN